MTFLVVFFWQFQSIELLSFHIQNVFGAGMFYEIFLWFCICHF